MGKMTGTELLDNRHAIAHILRSPRLWSKRYLRNRNGNPI